MSKIKIVNFTEGRYVQTVYGLNQWSYGQILRIQGVKLPSVVDVEFSLSETEGTSVARVGVTKDGVTDVPIPDFILEAPNTTDYQAYAFVRITDAQAGETVLKIIMAIKAQPKPEFHTTPPEENIFDETIKAVNDAANKAQSYAVGGTGTREGEDTDNSKYYSGMAGKYAQDSSLSAGESKDSANLANNFKEGAERAKNEAINFRNEAEQFKNGADKSATNANTSAVNAKQSEDNAKTSETNAGALAQNASQSATSAKDSADKAKISENSATTSAQSATTSATTATEQAVAAGRSATAAGTSEKNAKQSENNAGASATNAKVSEDNAKASESNAKASEDNAKQYEENTRTIASNTATETANLLTAEVKRATDNADKMAEEASKVNISTEQTDTGLIVRTTNRMGETTMTVLDTIVQLKDWKDIQTVVRQGNAKRLIHIGDTFFSKYTSPTDGKIYNIPWIVVAIKNVTKPDGGITEAVIIQMGKILPDNIIFDAWEAFYIAKEELPAGTYYVEIKEKWGDHHNAGDTWSFTLTKPVPKDGCLGGFHDTPYSGFTSTTVESYKSLVDTTPIESVKPTKSANGIKLGDFTFAGNEQLNSIQRCCYGYNNYAQSYQRQWLNSTGKGWWKPQNEYDLPPSDVASRYGFMTGFEDKFLSVLRPFKSVVGRNTITDGSGYDEVNDIFVLPALEEMYIKKQVSGEGAILPYWQEVSGNPEPWPWYTSTPELVHLDVNGSPRHVRLRSAGVCFAYYAWLVYSSGFVYDSYARYAFGSAPLASIY